jgi:hypothetical protein
VDRFEVDALDEGWPFEVDSQAAHLFKHPGLGLDDVGDVWASDPLFYPAKPPAHWLMVAEVGGRVLIVPLAPSNSGDARRCVRSAATSPPTTSPAATGRTDDPHDP